MKKKLLKFLLPISLGLVLSVITLFGLISTTFVSCTITCPSGELKGSDGDCYSCSSGSHTTYNYESASCSTPIAGVYCCPGGGSTGCHPTGCPSTAPWACGAECYATPPSGNHACIKCP